MSRLAPPTRAPLPRLLPGLLLAVACLLASCGKVGSPSPPGPPAEVIYPRSYPAVPAQ